MQKRVILIAIAIITISVSVAAVRMWIISQNNQSDFVEVGDEYIVMGPKPVAQRFTPGPIFCGTVTPYSARFSTQSYRVSTGESLDTEWYKYLSSVRAGKELQKRIKCAERIVERNANVDGSERVGERVVVIFPPGKNGIRRTSIFETNRSLFYAVTAPTLELALEFEGKK